MTATQSGADDFWRDARAYDAWFDSPWGEHAARVEARAVRRALGDVDGALVLDAGCGTGRLAATLRDVGARVIGVDREPAMLEVARPRVDQVVAGDIRALPMSDRSVDVALAVSVLEFVGDPSAAMAELARVVRPGGRVVIGALNRRSPWGLARRHGSRAPPWSRARFLTRRQLRALGTPYGRARIIGALHAPGVLPLRRVVLPVLETLGRAAPAGGAFQVLIVERPASRRAAPRATASLPHAQHVLAVCAHPDDETFGLGAILSAYVDRGATVDLVCLTHGEASTLGPKGAALGDTRVAELTDAARVLGLREVTAFGYADGGLADVPLGELAATLRPRAEAADLLLVFDDGGITGHPDHRRATAVALEVAESLDLPVLAWALRDDVAQALNTEFSAGFVGRPPSEIDATVPVDRARQRTAMRCHESQSADNPVPTRRLALTGDVEALRWLRRSTPVTATVSPTSTRRG